jgi:hypothetical protein
MRNIRIERDPARAITKIYWFDSEDGKRFAYYRSNYEDRKLKREEVPPGAEAPVYMMLDDDIIDAIIEDEAARQLIAVPKSLQQATAAARDDAIGVRDRVLAMLERINTQRGIGS